MLTIYDLACNIDILGTPRITASKGQFRTSDPRVQRILSRYPGVTLVATEPDTPAPCVGGEPAGNSPVRSDVPEVRNYVGVQMKERRPIGGRLSE